MTVRDILRRVMRKKVTDRTKEYWQRAANDSVDNVMEKICDGWGREEFANNKDSVVFHAKIPFSDNMTVLDLACGMGRLCRFVSPNVARYIGVDFIPEMIAKAKEYNKEYGNAEFYTNDGKSLSQFRNDLFDIVYCELAFQHMLKDVQNSYVKEVLRVLKKGGSFYANIPRLDFYKDNSYARKETEVKKMFESFDLELLLYEGHDQAYFLIKATKK